VREVQPVGVFALVLLEEGAEESLLADLGLASDDKGVFGVLFCPLLDEG